jgi:hypothetical protein
MHTKGNTLLIARPAVQIAEEVADPPSGEPLPGKPQGSVTLFAVQFVQALFPESWGLVWVRQTLLMVHSLLGDVIDPFVAR